jgi:hypothetical protein
MTRRRRTVNENHTKRQKNPTESAEQSKPLTKTTCIYFEKADTTSPGFRELRCPKCRDRQECHKLDSQKIPPEGSKPTTDVLEKPQPEEESKSFDEIMIETCGGRGPRLDKRKCANCQNFEECKSGFLNFFTPMPNYILDSMGSDLSGSAQRIFHVINRLVDFRREVHGKTNRYYNRCFATYKTLSEHSGVAESTIGKYVSELTREQYVWHNQRTDNNGGVFKTMNEFRVVWRIYADKLGVYYEKRGSL